MSDQDVSRLHAFLVSRMSYDPEDGRFFWLDSKSPRLVAGSLAGNISDDGYVRITFEKKRFLGHHLAWLYHHGTMAHGFIDHIDGDRSNNRISNLRECTESENQQNRAIQKNSSTGFIGVCRSKNKLQAQISLLGKNIYLGVFDTADEAHKAYLEAKAKLHPFSPVPRASGES